MSEILKKLEKIQNQSAEQTPSDSQFQESTKAPAREPQAQLAPRSKTILLSSFFGGLFLAMIGLFFSPLLSKKTSQEPRRPQVSISQKLPSQERSPAMTQVEPTLLKTVEELTKTGKIDEAISRLETETGNNPFLTRALFTLANLYQKKNKPDRATSTLMRILQIEPKNPLAYNNIGVIQLRQKRYKEAASFLKKACEYAPQTPDPWLNLAITHEQSMQLADSVENYAKYVELMSTDEARAQRTPEERRLLSAVNNRLLRLRAFANSEMRAPASSSSEITEPVTSRAKESP